MSIDRGNWRLQNRGRVKAPRRELDNRYHLLMRQMEPFHNFVNRGFRRVSMGYRTIPGRTIGVISDGLLHGHGRVVFDDAEESGGRAGWAAAVLFPVLKSLHADADQLRENGRECRPARRLPAVAQNCSTSRTLPSNSSSQQGVSGMVGG
jgi:hypothetical protein